MGRVRRLKCLIVRFRSEMTKGVDIYLYIAVKNSFENECNHELNISHFRFVPKSWDSTIKPGVV